MPIIALWAAGEYVPPQSATRTSLTSSHTCSVSAMTPSMSNTTAATMTAILETWCESECLGAAQTGLQRRSLEYVARCASASSRSRSSSYAPGESPCHITSGVTPGPMIVAR